MKILLEEKCSELGECIERDTYLKVEDKRVIFCMEGEKDIALALYRLDYHFDNVRIPFIEEIEMCRFIKKKGLYSILYKDETKYKVGDMVSTTGLVTKEVIDQYKEKTELKKGYILAYPIGAIHSIVSTKDICNPIYAVRMLYCIDKDSKICTYQIMTVPENQITEKMTVKSWTTIESWERIKKLLDIKN